MNTRNLEYGSGAIKAISDRLYKDLPGLRGYSASSLKNMRRFYEEWLLLDAGNQNIIQSPIAIGGSSQQSAIAIAESRPKQSAIAIADLQNAQNQIDIYHSIYVPNVAEFRLSN